MSINFDVKHLLRCTLFTFISISAVSVYADGDSSPHEHRSVLERPANGAESIITRSRLPAGIAERVSDRAIELAQSSEFEKARASWKNDGDYVWQIHYQLKFRAQTDYLSTEPTHLAKILSARPDNMGKANLNLYMSRAEAKEFERRKKLGERIADLRSRTGVKESAVEGEEPRRDANFAGIWQNQKDGGALVVALVEPSVVDRAELERLAGGSKNLRIIKVKYSWSEVDDYRDALLTAFTAYGLEASVRINSTGRGRMIEIVSPNVEEISRVASRTAPADLIKVVEGSLDVREGSPGSTHSESNQMPGMRIVFNPGSGCTWGVNGHTSNRNYLVTAGHCGATEFENFTGWTNDLEIYQNNSFHLTPGSQYLRSIDRENFDTKRMSSPQADSNCYHADGDCNRNIRWRARHNSWEVGRDTVCASLGTTNAYLCGFVLEENYSSTTSCSGTRWLRYDIDTTRGDSGAGIIGPMTSSDISIDATHSCGVGTSGIGNTAFDVKTQLNFDFNCFSSTIRGRAGSSWGPCPTINR